MTAEEVLVIKLGGSLLTDKSTEYKLKEDVIKAVAAEIKDCIDLGLIKSLVIIHGVGSFGHPPVLKYNLHRGFRNKDQLISMSKTQQIVNEFRKTIATTFLEEGVPINLMHASSMVVGSKMVITDYTFNSLKGFLSLGMVPLIGGDMMYDTSLGFSVCSGDQLAVVLSRVLHAKQLLFATDVPGVFDKDPKSEEHAQLLREININEIEQLFSNKNETAEADASGKMRGKLLSLASIKDQIQEGLEVAILSMKKKGVLKNYLKGEESELTKIIYN
ncbi:MAG TPA: isopentenyl phosphate kinase [Candidatus Nanopelagicaceae bacterium]|nr:isopentenyl phosphate kinase [Candidatus Nanopelagicaceae bacterium]